VVNKDFHKITCVCLSVSQCVCRRFYGRNFYSILMKFYTVVGGLKSKIEFVWGKNPITPFPILPQFYSLNAFSMGRFAKL